TAPDFGITTTSGPALSLTNSTGTGLQFTDVNGSAITGLASGIRATNTSTGDLSITSTGHVTNSGTAAGPTAGGIYVTTGATSGTATISANEVTGRFFGIYTDHSGTGPLSITTTGHVRADTTTNITNGNGIDATVHNGTGLTIETTSVHGADYGIRAVNNGSGDLSITSTGAVTADARSAINAVNNFNDDDAVMANDLTINATSASGGTYGIFANNLGTGATSVTATGAVSGTTQSGVSVHNNDRATDLSVNTAAVTGGAFGIVVDNEGTGTTSVTATGHVSGALNSGIAATSRATAEGVTINATSVTGHVNGITADNFGGGEVNITATDTVIGTTMSGINAVNNTPGGGITINAATVTGDSNGIFAHDMGSGPLSITATGTVTGTNDDGIEATNDSPGTDLTITTAAVYGGNAGIIVDNSGSGALTITASDTVTGATAHGISANNNAGTDLTINATTVNGGSDGIYAANIGTGVLSVTTSGNVTSTGAIGITVSNASAGTSLTVDTGAVSGFSYGIYAESFGSDALSITTSGNVTGGTDDGIYATTDSAGNGLTIDTASVSGGDDGIYAVNFGSGALSVTTSGDVTGAGATGITAVAGSSSTGLTIDTASVTGNTYGIYTEDYGSGALSITTSGNVTGTTADGIYANNASGTGLTISTASATGAAYGINARNDGVGSTTVTSTGTVTGTSQSGISVTTMLTDLLTINAENVSGGVHGIYAQNPDATSTTIVNVGGTVTGGTGIGVYTFSDSDAGVEINLLDGATVSATSGSAVEDFLGDAVLTLNTGSSVSGTVQLGLGSDQVVFAGGDFSGVTQFDGGDDSDTADGYIDTAIFRNQTLTTGFSRFINFEGITIDGGTVTNTDTALTLAGGAPGAGLTVTNGGTFVTPTNFALTGDLTTTAGGIFDASAGGNSVTGNVSNGGQITLAEGTAGDSLTINGNYTGNGGSLVLDTALDGDGSTTDSLIVTGDATGSTRVFVRNAGGSGAQTTDGIRLIDIQGASTGSFALVGDYTYRGDPAVVGGAYAYRLYQNGINTPTDGDWYLRSALLDNSPHYQPAVAVAEVYPQALLAFNGLPTLRQRVGGRYWDAFGPEQMQGQGDGTWARIDRPHGSIDPDESTSGASYDYDLFLLQAGIDRPVLATDAGILIGSLTAHYGRMALDVNSHFGDGSIDTDGYGIGGALTWYGLNGFYVDAQARATWYDSDLHSDSLGTVTSGNDGFGYALSIEGGKQIAVSDRLAVTPQAQLTWSSVDFDDFSQNAGGRRVASMSLQDGDSLQGRLGISLDWEKRNGTHSRTRAYGIANLYYEFRDGTSVDISDTTLSSRSDRLWAGIGLGGSHDWGDGKFSLYGEALVTSSLENPGDSYTVGGTVGLRMKW
ncbi:MAG: autotransporter outer membrane beta-barrel domain-containing protein, partial [Tropicimonas sp.]|uniref:autotransporter outer membrane beta-barrel domain-containing protein n=1 Tax=Tropicimonas sp. TaxID=2067044 RepID=UPI003A85107B